VEVDASTPGQLRADFSGKSNSRDPGKVLKPWFDQVLALAGNKGAQVVLHFEKLQYFNSSTIAALIQMLNAAQDKKVSLELVYDGKLRWQTLSFDALKRAIRPFDSGGAAAVTIKPV
jgi:hypothetical protein